jgi:hypothetical protein
MVYLKMLSAPKTIQADSESCGQPSEGCWEDNLEQEM